MSTFCRMVFTIEDVEPEPFGIFGCYEAARPVVNEEWLQGEGERLRPFRADPGL